MLKSLGFALVQSKIKPALEKVQKRFLKYSFCKVNSECTQKEGVFMMLQMSDIELLVHGKVKISIETVLFDLHIIS